MSNPVTKGKGKTFLWICGRVAYDGDDCVAWPFNRVRGYGTLTVNGKPWKAHRLMCVLAHGMPATTQHEAAHSCGNGDNGCMNPRHLSWKTRGENQLDRRTHGTQGKRVPRRRMLTPLKVLEIRALIPTETKADLARRFGVTRSTIRQIELGKTWQRMYISEEREKIAAALGKAGRPLRIEEVVTAASLSNITTAYNVLSSMARAGEVRRLRRGMYELCNFT